MAWGMKNSTFGPPPVVYTESYVQPGLDGISPATRTEFEDGPGFFARFEGLFTVEDLRGRDVLDLGCGYGGRTAYYALHGAPRSIVGIEINHRMVRTARDSAAQYAPEADMHFLVSVGEHLPFRDASFDLILTYDVFEHVQDLGAVLGECSRTLRPGGRVVSLFPPYYGPRAHHLDYITTLPFLHHAFSSEVLVEAANRIIADHPELERQPLPARRGREPLPTLNGTTVRGFRRLVSEAGFEVEHLFPMPFAWGPGGAAKRAVHAVFRGLAAAPWPFTEDVFVGSIRSILRKPDRLESDL